MTLDQIAPVLEDLQCTTFSEGLEAFTSGKILLIFLLCISPIHQSSTSKMLGIESSSSLQEMNCYGSEVKPWH